MEINPENLMKELRVANVKTGGCNSNGIVWGDDGLTEIQERKDVKAILKKHDPMPIPVETLEEKIGRIVDEKLSAR